MYTYKEVCHADMNGPGMEVEETSDDDTEPNLLAGRRTGLALPGAGELRAQLHHPLDQGVALRGGAGIRVAPGRTQLLRAAH